MQKPLNFLASLGFAITLALPVAAQDTKEDPSIDTIVATVNGTEITLGHMIAAHATLPQQYQQLPADILWKGILDQLVQQTAIHDTFKGDVPKRIEIQLENERRSLIAGDVMEGVMERPVEEADVIAAYEEEYANKELGDEFNASHILVESKEDADAIKKQLDEGADFAELAKEKSTGPSGPSGGSLGWFQKGAMVPEFEEAVMALEPGAVSEPVQTQFGWHVITLLDRRPVEAPALEDVREELELQVRQMRFEKEIEKLTESADIQTKEVDIDPTVLQKLELLD